MPLSILSMRSSKRQFKSAYRHILASVNVCFCVCVCVTDLCGTVVGGLPVCVCVCVFVF